MQDRQSGQLIHPKPVTIHFLMFRGIDGGRIRRIGGCAENGIRGQHAIANKLAKRRKICAVGRDGRDFLFTPFGHIADGNPFDAYLPPSEPPVDPSAS